MKKKVFVLQLIIYELILKTYSKGLRTYLQYKNICKYLKTSKILSLIMIFKWNESIY